MDAPGQSSSVNEERSRDGHSNERPFELPPASDRKRKLNAISAPTVSPNPEQHSAISQEERDKDAMEVDSSNDTEEDNTIRDRLDRIATRQEEAYVMGQILRNIEVSERQYAHGDLVNEVRIMSPDSDRYNDIDLSTIRPWTLPSNMGPQFPNHPWRRTRPKNNRGRPSKTRKEGDMGEVVTIRREIQRSLPRWIPGELGFYDENGPLVLLFTRQQFMQNVVLKAEKKIDRLGPEHKEWKATLSDQNPSDPRSYLLEASGSEEALEILLELTETFVREQIDRTNLDLLLEDGASLVLNVKCSVNPRSETKEQALGVSFSSATSSDTEGVLIKSVKPKGILAKTYPKVFSKGCALLAVNNKKISILSDVEEHLMQFKHQLPKPRSPVQVELSICVSKFANLRNSPNISSWNIHRRDGIEYDREDYERFQLDKCIEWLQRGSKKDNKPVQISDEDDLEDEDGSSSADEIPRSPTPNREDSKPKVRAMLSDSESSLDVAFHENDEESDEEQTKPKPKKLGLFPSHQIRKVQAQSGYAIFKLFEDKMKPLLLLDYRDTKINIKSICSSMWKKHKDLFGEDERCDDKCKCLMWLPEMTANVITDHIEKQKDNNLPVETEEELENRTRGISKHFVPKFIPLLQDKYPQETEAQLIHRLVEMWEVHQRHRMYGIKCRKECACTDEWDTIFGKGDKATAKEYASTMKRPSPPAQSSPPSGTEKSSSSSLAVPRKNSTVPRKKRDHEKNSNMNRKMPRLSGLISSMKSREAILEVGFDSSTPLGGYFRTKQNQCQVFSIYPKGQMAKETKIVNGCSVLSVKIGGGPITISSHSDLEKRYDEAKQKKSMISITFGNQGAKRTLLEHQRINEIGWNDSGHWVGTHNLDENDGWAGGATIGPKPSKKAPKKTTERNGIAVGSPMHNIDVNGVTNDIAPNIQQKEIANSTSEPEHSEHNNIEEWTTIVNTINAYDKDRRPSKSIFLEKSSFPPPVEEEEKKEDKGLSKLLNLSAMRSRRERTHSKKITISLQNNEEIFFCKDDATNMRKIFQIKKGARQQDATPMLDPEQDLINAFRKKSCNDVLQILESQEFLSAVSQGRFDFQALLRRQYSFIGAELKKVSASESYSALPEKRDLRAKHKILNIYINCIHLIEKTLALKKWYALTIELKYIDFQHRSSIVDEISGNIVVKLDDGNMKENFGNLPVKTFSGHISYVDDNLIYTTHNNKNFLFEKRSLVIDLKKVSSTFSPDRMLGAFNIQLNDIEDKCLSDQTPTEFMASLSKSDNHELSSGHVTLNIRKKSADKDYVMNKKQDIINKLKLQMEYIDRFNNDPNTPTGARLTANMLCRGGNSLLHAAVVLMDDADLVRSMLKLGANPGSNFHSGVGTPLTLAQRHLHLALDRQRQMRLKNVDTGQQVLRCNQARALVEMLQRNVIEFPPDATPGADPSPEHIHESQPSDKHQAALTKNTPITQASGDMMAQAESYPEKPAKKTPSVTKQWATNACLGAVLTICRSGPKCPFYKKGSCRYFHIVYPPLPNEPQAAVPRLGLPKDDSKLPRYVSDYAIFYSECVQGGSKWWTAAVPSFETNQIIHVQKVLKSGWVADNGVVWFQSKEAALHSLRCTVYLIENARPQNQKKNHKSGGSSNNHKRQEICRYIASSNYR